MKYNYSLPNPGSSEYEEAEYKGEFKAGKRHGEGTMTWINDGSNYKGIWSNDKRHKGVMEFANGQIYKGGFYNDKLHGLAYLLLNNGVVFHGEFD